MSRWKKGPWYAHGGSVYASPYPDCSRPIADMRRDETATKAKIYPVERDENARLIAAAPEMAECLVHLLEYVEPCGACEGSGKNLRDPLSACRICGGCGELLALGAISEVSEARALLARIEGER